MPLALTAKIAARDIVAGYSECRCLTVLARFRPPLREMATVRIDVRPADEGSIHAVRVIVETRLLVNPQATTKREDWQLPTPPQEAADNAAVFETVRQALPSGCAAPLWRSESSADVRCLFELRTAAVGLALTR